MKDLTTREQRLKGSRSIHADIDRAKEVIGSIITVVAGLVLVFMAFFLSMVA